MTPYYEEGGVTLYHGDALDALRAMPDNCVDAVVTDPPYGFAFMGKKWDYDLPSVEIWAEVLRVAKPGAHLLAFGGARTYHRAVCRIEDAGFEIRDCIQWIYGSGFPKSLNLKGEWEGWGTALKPAYEPIALARKPLTGTVAANVEEWRCGALNVDGCRIPAASMADRLEAERKNRHADFGSGARSNQVFGADTRDRSGQGNYSIAAGRWPANIIHDGSAEVLAGFPETASIGHHPSKRNGAGMWSGEGGGLNGNLGSGRLTESGSAARFFYCAKPSKREREAGVSGIEPVHRVNGNKWTDQDCRVTRGERPPSAESGPRSNHHPTVKPIALMRYLCRLITPPGGVVLDPFTGSGTTGAAALLEGFQFVGVEREAEYVEIAKHRVTHWARDEKEETCAPLFAGIEDVA